MIGWLRRVFQSNSNTSSTHTVSLRARYDAAATTPDNAQHWAQADSLSPTAALTSNVRRTLRNRARYEVANNSYANGIVATIANYTIGTGPVLQVRTANEDFNLRFERAWSEWCAIVDLPEILRIMRRCIVVDGEAFAILCNYPRQRTKVKLAIRLVEPEQISEGPASVLAQPVEGIVFDDYGVPAAYHVLRRHPGDINVTDIDYTYETVPADSVIHYFHRDRPGQWRGVPEITPALPLFSILRRFTLATAAAAETAANLAAVLQTDSAAYIPRDAERFARELVWQFVDLRPRSATVLPPGWRLSQMTAQHPTTTYGDFVYHLMSEIARCLNVPVVVALNDSSRANFSSGRLDLRNWYRSLEVERARIESIILEPLLRAFYREWRVVDSETSTLAGLSRDVPDHEWYWPALEGVDPEKEAKAQALRLQNGLTTFAYEYAKQGRDWMTELRQRAKEYAFASELGLGFLFEKGGNSDVQDDQEVPSDSSEGEDSRTES
jgi:lambda family phage portal protein